MLPPIVFVFPPHALRTVEKDPSPATAVVCLYDHEEVGSRSAAGAAGNFLADVLDRVVSGILELENSKVKYYKGNYTAYRKIRQERLAAQQSQYNAQQQRLAHLEALVRKFGDIAQGHASDTYR